MPCIRALLLATAAVAGTASSLPGELLEDTAAQALEQDETCEGDAETCDLSLRQLRGEKLRMQRKRQAEAAAGSEISKHAERLEDADETSYWHGSCHAYGCHHTYHPTFRCQCNPGCKHHGNCCQDYADKCTVKSDSDHTAGHESAVAYTITGSCEDYGCNHAFKRYLACQCNHECKWYKNCCHDYDATCHAHHANESILPEDAAQAPAPAVPVAVEGVEGAGGSGNVTGVLGHPSSTKQYPEHDGFTLFLAEEFDDPIDLDNDPIWTWSDGGLAEGQTRFVKEQVKFEDGKMKLEVKPNPGIDVQMCSRAMSGELFEMPLVSGELRSRHNWFRYGRYEVRLKTPSIQPGNTHVNGNYISTMFLYRDANFHHWREIDFEITGDTSHSVTTNMLYADYKLTWSPKIQHSLHLAIHGSTREEFHTYAFEWLPNKIAWFIDGKKVREIRKGRLPIPDMAGKVMMNLWVFGHHAYFGGRQLHNNKYPFHSEYDWFRFYKWNGDSDYPCDGLSTACLSHEDTFLSGNNPCDGQNQTGYKEGKKVCQPTCNS